MTAKTGATRYPAPIRDIGSGWLASVDLPLGVTPAMVADRRAQLASVSDGRGSNAFDRSALSLIGQAVANPRPRALDDYRGRPTAFQSPTVLFRSGVGGR